jgi:hypothetical protein
MPKSLVYDITHLTAMQAEVDPGAEDRVEGPVVEAGDPVPWATYDESRIINRPPVGAAAEAGNSCSRCHMH